MNFLKEIDIFIGSYRIKQLLNKMNNNVYTLYIYENRIIYCEKEDNTKTNIKDLYKRCKKLHLKYSKF